MFLLKTENENSLKSNVTLLWDAAASFFKFLGLFQFFHSEMKKEGNGVIFLFPNLLGKDGPFSDSFVHIFCPTLLHSPIF